MKYQIVEAKSLWVNRRIWIVEQVGVYGSISQHKTKRAAEKAVAKLEAADNKRPWWDEEWA